MFSCFSPLTKSGKKPSCCSVEPQSCGFTLQQPGFYPDFVSGVKARKQNCYAVFARKCVLLCDRKPRSRTSGTQKMQAPVPVPGSTTVKRSCKPASHHEPTIFVHVPANVCSPFATPSVRRHKPLTQSANSRDQPTTPAAALGTTSDLWSSPSYRPVDSNVIAYRAVMVYEDEIRPDVSSEKLNQHLSDEADRPLNKTGDVASTSCLPQNLTSDTEPTTGHDSSHLAQSDASVHTQNDERIMPLTQQLSGSAYLAGRTSSLHSHVCLIHIVVDFN